MKRLFRLLPLLCMLPLTLRGAEETASRIFAPTFRTMQLRNTVDFFAPPVWPLGDDRVTLNLTFDELGDDRRYLRYSIEHLTPDWKPSDLVPSEYASGFNEGTVEDFAFSQNTYRHYVNYRIVIPSEQLTPLISGNYLLRVWDEDEPSETLLQSRFCVSEQVGTIAAEATHITDRGSDGPYQQLNFTYKAGDFPLRDPFADIRVAVVQNSDPATAVWVKPLRVQGKELIYEHRPELLFRAGNEFRRFETTRTDYTGMHVEANRFDGDGYTATLATDYGRADRPYVYDSTQQGRYMVNEYYSSDPDLGADYVMTEFTLDFPRVMNGDVHLRGALTDYRTDDSTRLRYDEETHTYRLPLLLKQGSYNYQYVLKDPQTGAVTPAPVEGDFYETRNEYTIYVYYTPPGARYARLLNVTSIR